MLVIFKAEKEECSKKRKRQKGRVRDAERRNRELNKILCLHEMLDPLSLWLMRIRVNSQMSLCLQKEEYC